MTTANITREEILAVYPKVAQTMADALGCDVEKVALNVPLIEGLEAESIDFLDIVFRLERAFKVKIPRGKIVEDARGDLPEAEFEQKGYLTEVGLERLRDYLSEVPADRFRLPMKVADIPRLFTPETFCKVVVRALRAVQGDDSRGRVSEGTGAPNTDG
jgi:acyl carrier protein